MTHVKILHGYTKDNLNLQGFHWESALKKTCVILIHGMSENIIENYFAEILGDQLSESGYGFIFGHNRGFGHINDIRTLDMEGDKTVRIGQIYERFQECSYDIDLWINQAKNIGYEEIILMGHSLGCNKIIHYLVHNQNNVSGIILASPPDMVGLSKLQKYQPNYDEMLIEARKNVENGDCRKILHSMLWEWYFISSQTFLDLCVDGSFADNLPLLRNPDVFEELSQIHIPIFAFMGEHDDIIIRSLKDDLNLIKQKATSCTDFDLSILDGANHMYVNKEYELSNLVLRWLKKRFAND